MTLKIIELVLAFVFVWLAVLLPSALIWQIFKKKVMFHISFEQLVKVSLCLALAQLTWSLATSYHTIKWNQFVNLLMGVPTQAGQAQPQPQQPQGAEKYPVASGVKEFLTLLNTALQDPTKVTPEMLKNLAASRNTAFPDQPTKEAYFKSLLTFHQCQIDMYNDAISALKSGTANDKNVEKCTREPGQLFGRDELIPADIINGFKNLILSASKKEKIKQANGQEVEITEPALQQAQSFETQKLKVLNDIFQAP